MLLMYKMPKRPKTIIIRKCTKEKDIHGKVYVLFFILKYVRGVYNMKYQVQENCLTIFLPGELDHHNAEEIRKESDHLIEHNHIRYVIFDFADTKFCDSSGIGVIMGRYRKIFICWAVKCVRYIQARGSGRFL